MTSSERFCYMQAARLELSALCRRTVTDGRDPDIVAFSMTQNLARKMAECHQLWDSLDHAN